MTYGQGMEKNKQHPPVVYALLAALVAIIVKTHIGTNTGLLALMWAIASGQLLLSRGAIIPALDSSGLDKRQTKRAWAASCYGNWNTNEMLAAWQRHAKEKCGWKALEHGGYSVIVADMVGIFRPKLKDCPSKHHDNTAGKALPAIELGMIAQIGAINGKRQALLCKLIRVPAATKHSHKALKDELIKQICSLQGSKEIAVFDREFKAHEVLKYGSGYFVVRATSNATFCRSSKKLKASKLGRPTSKRTKVRPLPHKYKSNISKADTPDEIKETELTIEHINPKTGEIRQEKLTVIAEIWRDLRITDDTLKSMKLAEAEQQRIYDTPLTLMVIKHPEFKTPMILVSNVPDPLLHLDKIYVDRWPIEGIPQTGKLVLGGQREFVHNREHCQRLPELVLLTGNVLATVAAAHPAIPTGFWDKLPKSTSGRLRRLLFKVGCMPEIVLPDRIREKNSCVAHLVTGHAARLLKKPKLMPTDRGI
jgi:hypothetical protein